jgi:hypothetical protein
MVSFVPWLIYPPEKKVSPLLDRRRVGPQSWYEYCGKIKIFLPLLGIDVQSYPVSILTELGHYYRFIVCLIRNKSVGEKVGNPHVKLQAFNIF